MKKRYLHIFSIVCLISCFPKILSAQCINGFTPAGSKCGGPVQTTVAFLGINPDARAAGMGDAGIAISPDANAMQFNASKLASSDQKWGAELSYTPWLRNLNVNDIYLAFGSGYYQIPGSVKQAIGISLKYFSLGDITWTDGNSQVIGMGSPREYAIAAAYARQLSPEISIGFTAKYINSNLASGQSINSTQPIRTGTAGAADLSFTYKKPIKSAAGKGDFTFGAAITNIGNKVNYLIIPDYIPTNLGLGFALNKPFDPLNRIVFAVDFNKLLVPTPIDKVDDPNQEWRKAGIVDGLLKGLTSAPGGFSEKIQEVTASLGVEYWYDNQFAFRAGYFYEDKNKGGRQYLTVGLGLKYTVLGINLSYLVPTSSQRGPLDNTLRFSLNFEPGYFKNAEASPSEN